MSETMLKINEIFGPTWQGEGRQTGQLACFVRLATCNLGCVWCDTPHAVFYDARKAKMHRDHISYDPKVEIHNMTPEEVVEKIVQLVPRGTLVVFTGGEPLLQQSAISEVIELLYAENFANYAIETAGTIMPSFRAALRYSQNLQWNVSPKLGNSGNSYAKRRVPHVIESFAKEDADFKFVVTGPEDFSEVANIIRQANIVPHRVWIMPEGIKGADVIWNARKLMDEVLKFGWNLTLRQHVILHDDLRGV
jgi:7-carboxy-7-deazaguanine synthase